MRIGTSGGARSLISNLLPRGIDHSPTLQLPRSVLLVLLMAAGTLGGCKALVNFGDFEFSDVDHEKDAGKDSGPNGDPDSGSDKDAAVDEIVPDAGADTGTGDNDGGSDSGMSCPSPTESCDDDQDNDCDGLEDCDDPDCASDGACCRPTQIPETSCSGGIDEDCDGNIDCVDADCSSSALCCTASGPEVGATACGDGSDNDCDGLIDCAETSCVAQANCCNATGDENTNEACGDGMDNDCDGKKDCLDPECALVANCCTPDGLENATTINDTTNSCNDDKDNDCDGLVDCREVECASYPICATCTKMPPNATSEATLCGDNFDNDCDKDRDCRDSDCAESFACCVPSGAENDGAACVDGLDNDCDGYVDCDDPDCAGQLSCCVASPENSMLACMDAVDNDCDGQLDCSDSNCQGTSACCSPTGPENSMMACTDAVDNDCDGKVNCGDSDCNGIPGTGCCVNSGAENDSPNDGKDNDCDGLVDIPILNAANPTQGLPASGAEVGLAFVPEVVSGAMLECSTRRLSALSVPVWTACPMNGASVRPHTSDQSANPGNNGAWVTDVRWRFPNGTRSQVYTFRYYIHSSLDKVEHCTTPVSDERWFSKAAERLNDPNAGTFRLGADTFLANPFVRVHYTPPNATLANYHFDQDGSPQSVDMWSLRRRFTLSGDQRYLLITRNYKSRRGPPGGTCNAATLRSHFGTNKVSGGNLNSRFYKNYCRAVVLNRAGAGVCLREDGSNAAFAHNANDSYANSLGWNRANKFMWRQLVEKQNITYSGGVPSEWGFRNFTKKCKSAPCMNGLVLPDRALFP